MNDTAVNSLFNKLEKKIKELEGRVEFLESKLRVYQPIQPPTLDPTLEEYFNEKFKCKIKSSK